MELSEYRSLREEVAHLGYEKEIEWAETVGPPESGRSFACEAIWVILNSGMKNTVARRIATKVFEALGKSRSAHTAFGHEGKADAIDRIWTEASALLKAYRASEDKLAFLEGLPWIGSTTKYHLAKNLGMDVVKPDRHLLRIAGHYGTTPHALCAQLAGESGDRIGTVDYVLWRAAERGLLDTREMAREASEAR